MATSLHAVDPIVCCGHPDSCSDWWLVSCNLQRSDSSNIDDCRRWANRRRRFANDVQLHAEYNSICRPNYGNLSQAV